jgi:L-lactate dehydrogenase
MSLRKAMIVGAGQVGMACAYSMLIQGTLNEMVITDINQSKAIGEVMDLVHGIPFVQPTKVQAGTFADGVGADIVIITAGAKQQPGESRLALVQRNVEIFKSMIPEIVRYCPDAVLLIVSNPVDIMTYVSLKLSGLPLGRVMGSGTVLDTARFRYLLAEELQLDSRSVHAYIIGEHGDSEVPVWSKVNVAGTPLSELGDGKVLPLAKQQQIFDQVKNAAYEIIQRKGATCYAIGLATTQIVEAILRNQNRVLTVSSWVHDRHGLTDLCLSLPSVVNRQGVERMLDLSLDPVELAQLQNSGKILRQILDQIALL